MFEDVRMSKFRIFCFAICLAIFTSACGGDSEQENALPSADTIAEPASDEEASGGVGQTLSDSFGGSNPDENSEIETEEGVIDEDSELTEEEVADILANETTTTLPESELDSIQAEEEPELGPVGDILPDRPEGSDAIDDTPIPSPEIGAPVDLSDDGSVDGSEPGVVDTEDEEEAQPADFAIPLDERAPNTLSEPGEAEALRILSLNEDFIVLETDTALTQLFDSGFQYPAEWTRSEIVDFAAIYCGFLIDEDSIGNLQDLALDAAAAWKPNSGVEPGHMLALATQLARRFCGSTLNTLYLNG